MAIDRLDPGQGSISQSVKAATQAERDAQDRIQLARKRVQEAQIEADSRLEHVKDEYIRRSETEAQRQEIAYSAQKDKGYENIREMLRAQAAEEARILKQGEREREQVGEHYRDEIFRVEQDGKEKLESIQLRGQTERERSAQKLSDETSAAEANHRLRMETLQSSKERHFEASNRQALEEYQRVSANHQLASQEARTQFEGDYATLVKKNKEILAGIDSRAAKAVDAIRQDTAAKLAAYGARQEDPFYQMMSVEARLDETKEAYILTAMIPEHERESLSVNVRGDQLVIGVKRRNEERIEGKTPGKSATTSAYQAYTESFPLASPVESRYLSKEFDGDLLVVTLPKKGLSSKAPRHVAPEPERIKAERPRFPENLPIAGNGGKPSGKSGRTLT